MFEDRTSKRTFYSAPQRVGSLVAAFLEPGITGKESLGLDLQIITRTIRLAFFE